MNKLSKIFFSSLALTAIANTANAFVKKDNDIIEEMKFCYTKINGVTYQAGRSRYFSKNEESAVLQRTQYLLDLDNKFVKLFEENKELVPFKDQYEEYREVIKGLDELLKNILLDNFSEKTVQAYQNFQSKHIQNFEKMVQLAEQRGGFKKIKIAKEFLKEMKSNANIHNFFFKCLRYS